MNYFKCTRESLSNTKFVPCKDYSTGLMQKGILGMPTETILIIDETEFDEGQLSGEAFANIKAL